MGTGQAGGERTAVCLSSPSSAKGVSYRASKSWLHLREKKHGSRRFVEYFHFFFLGERLACMRPSAVRRFFHRGGFFLLPARFFGRACALEITQARQGMPCECSGMHGRTLHSPSPGMVVVVLCVGRSHDFRRSSAAFAAAAERLAAGAFCWWARKIPSNS